MKKWFDTLRKERKIRKDKRKEENVWNQFPDSGKILPVPPPTPNASHSQLQNVPPPSPQFDVKKIKKKKSGISIKLVDSSAVSESTSSSELVESSLNIALPPPSIKEDFMAINTNVPQFPINEPIKDKVHSLKISDFVKYQQNMNKPTVIRTDNDYEGLVSPQVASSKSENTSSSSLEKSGNYQIEEEPPRPLTKLKTKSINQSKSFLEMFPVSTVANEKINYEELESYRDHYNWNNEFQEALASPTEGEQAIKLLCFFEKFTMRALGIAEFIIKELSFNNSQRKIHSNAFHSYVFGGIHFQLSDSNSDFSDRGILNELKGASCVGWEVEKDKWNYFKNGTNKFLKILRFPYIQVLDLKGYRFMVTPSDLPLDISTLQVSLCNHGKVIDTQEDSIIQQVSSNLYYKLNLISPSICQQPECIEECTKSFPTQFHRSKNETKNDKSIDPPYLVNMGKLFNHIQETGTSKEKPMGLRFRPEFVKSYEHPFPINSNLGSKLIDIFSKSPFSSGTDDDFKTRARSKSEPYSFNSTSLNQLKLAYISLVEEIIPKLAITLEQDMDARIKMYFSPSDNQTLSTNEKKAFVETLDWIEEIEAIIIDLHNQGINIRYLAHLYNVLRAGFLKQLILVEILARVAKNELRSTWRELRGYSEHIFRDMTLAFLNTLVRRDIASRNFWETILKPKIEMQFPGFELSSDLFIQNDIPMNHFINRVAFLCGLDIQNNESCDSITRVRILPKIKPFYLVKYSDALLLERELTAYFEKNKSSTFKFSSSNIKLYNSFYPNKINSFSVKAFHKNKPVDAENVTKQWEYTVSLFFESAKLFPNHPFTLMKLANLCQLRAGYEEDPLTKQAFLTRTERYYTRAAWIEDEPEVILKLANFLHFELKQPHKAGPWWLKLLAWREIIVEHPQIEFHACQYLITLSKFQEAADLLEKYLKPTSSNSKKLGKYQADIYRLYAYCMQQLRLTQLSEEYFMQSLQTDPNSTLALRWYAMFLWNQGNVEKANQLLLQELEIRKKGSLRQSPYLYVSLGNEKMEQAELLGLIARTYFYLNKIELAQKFFEDSIELHPIPSILYSYGTCLWQYRPEKRIKATELFSKAAALDPTVREYKLVFACSLWTTLKVAGVISGRSLLQVHAAFKSVIQDETSTKFINPEAEQSFKILYNEYNEVYQRIVRVLQLRSNVDIEELFFEIKFG